MIVAVNEQNFAQVLAQHPHVLVDAWAEWCPPCKRMDPILDELAREHEGRLVVAKLNTDDNPKLAQQQGIMGMPTFLFFKNGKRVDQLSGFTPKPQLEARIRGSFGL